MKPGQAYQTAQQIALRQIADRCKTDLYYLCKYILGYDIVDPKTHGPLCQYMRVVLMGEEADQYEFPSDYGREEEEGMPTEEEKKQLLEWLHKFHPTSDGTHTVEDQMSYDCRHLLALMPRGTLKSSIITIGFTIQKLLNDPNARILIDSETFTKSTAFLSEIKGHFEDNEKLRNIFYSVYQCYPDDNRKKDKWTDSAVNIAARTKRRKEESVSCGGIDALKTGMHYDVIIGDDLHSEKNTQNKDQIEQVKEHWKLLFPLLDPGKPMVIVGTRWSYMDLYQYIIDEEAERFNFITRAAEAADGDLLWPSVLNRQELDRIRRSLQAYHYSCQYMNNPVDDETAYFQRSMFSYVAWDRAKDMPINWFVSIDPSFKGPESDYAAFVCLGMDHQRELYVRAAMHFKLNYAEIVRLTFDWYEKYHPLRMAIETVAGQKNIQYMMHEEQKRRGYWLPLKEINHRSDSKEERIKALSPFYEFGRVHHVRESPGLADLEYELIHFPKGKHDDMIDALATGLEIATPPSPHQKHSEERAKKKEKLKSFNKPKSPTVGY